MCIRDRDRVGHGHRPRVLDRERARRANRAQRVPAARLDVAVSYTHLRAHETVLDLVCRLLLEKKKKDIYLILLCDIVGPTH